MLVIKWKKEELNLKIHWALDTNFTHRSRNQLCYTNFNVKIKLLLLRELGEHFLVQYFSQILQKLLVGQKSIWVLSLLLLIQNQKVDRIKLSFHHRCLSFSSLSPKVICLLPSRFIPISSTASLFYLQAALCIANIPMGSSSKRKFNMAYHYFSIAVYRIEHEYTPFSVPLSSGMFL